MSSYTSSATFYVTVTGLYGYSSPVTVTVNSTTTTTYTGGSQVVLTPDFTAIAQSSTPTFIANIAPPPFYPNSGSGSGANFVISASDPNGYQNITNVQIIYNWQPTGVDGCRLNYDVVNDALTIGDLTGSMSTFGSISLLNPSGTLGDLVNSNCQIIGLGSSLSGSGNNLTLTLNTHFRPPTGSGDPLSNPPGVPGFIGSQNIYMLTTSSDQQQPGSFQLVGTWTAYPVPHPGTYSNINPLNSINSDGTVTVQFNNENGVGYATYAQMVFGTSQTDPAACRVQYNRGTGAANYTLTLYAGGFNQVSEIGEGPVPDPGGVVQDNSTCILDIGHSYVVFDSGTTAIVNMALTFKNTGTINTYAQAFDRQNVPGALQQSSIYIPPNNFSLSPVSAFSVQQSGSPASFVVSAPASGNFSGTVSLTYTAPAGVTLTFNSTSLSTPGSASSTAVQVNASASATLGTGNIAITGTSGSLTYTLNIPVTVTPATPPPAPASGFSLSSVTAVVVQQSGTAASFALNVATTGSFSGPVTFTYSAPSGVSLAFQTNPLTVPASSSTNVQVTASSLAAVAAGNITITATSGSQTATLSIPVTVTAATPVTPPAPPATPTPTFILSGGQQEVLNVSSYTSSATFYVTVTGLYGYSSPVTVTISPSTTSAISATINGSNSATVSPGQAVPVLLQGLGAATAAASAAANNLNFWCTDVIGSDANGLQVQSGALCIDFNGATSSVSFSIPSAANGITVPAGGSTTIYGSVSTYGGAATPTITQSVSCPSGVFPCSASASVSAPSGGSVAIGLNAGSLPVGTTYTHCFYANGQGQCLGVTVGTPGNSQGFSLVSANCSSCTSGPPPLTTDNDGSTSSANYYVQCMNFSCTTASVSCTVPDSQNITLTTTTTSTSASRLYFTISAVANTVAFAGTYALNCPLTSPAFSTTLSAGSLVVYDATPVITNVNPSPVAPGLQNIYITGHNFGNSPTVTIGGAPAAVPAVVGIGSLVTIPVQFSVPASAAGTTLQVVLTSTGEFGHAFFQNSQIATGSNPQSAAFPLGVSDNGPVISNVTQPSTQTLYPGAVAQANGVNIQIFGNNFGASPGTITICVHNTVPGQPCTASGISASITNSSGNPAATWTNSQVNALLTASANTATGLYDVWLTASTDANGNPFVGSQATTIYANGVSVSAINIQLQQVGPTVISTDGNYTEDTTISVTAVAAQGGATVTNFTGTVNIVEVSTVPIYSQNATYTIGPYYTQVVPTGAGLPSSATISSGGTTTLLARSLASPSIEGPNGAPPNPAIITSTHSPAIQGDYPPYQGLPLSIPQWISGDPIDPTHAVGTGTALYDWLQARARDIYAANPPGAPAVSCSFAIQSGAAMGDVATVLCSGSTYTANGNIPATTGAGATPATYGATTQIQINPFYTQLRMNYSSPTDLLCGNVATAAFNALFLHEARHAYQNTIVSINGNDMDQDHLSLNTAPVAPFNIFQDTTAFRSVCNVTTNLLQSLAYQGDGIFDFFDAPGFVRYALEMDAYTFAGNHQ